MNYNHFRCCCVPVASHYWRRGNANGLQDRIEYHRTLIGTNTAGRRRAPGSHRWLRGLADWIGFHLAGDTRSEMEAAWRFVRSGALVLGTIEHAELQHVHGLMSRYWDRPMDFADGTLVYLARREFLSVILTVDHADFATYRIEGKRQFRVLPANHP